MKRMVARRRNGKRSAARGLRAAEPELPIVIENLTEGVVVASLDGRLLHWNRAALDMHGFATLDECRRKLPELRDTFEITTLDGAKIDVDEWPLSRILRGEIVREAELCVRHRHVGWRRVFSYGGRLVPDTSGHSLMAVVMVSDITDRKRAEQALRESERRLALALEGSNDGLWNLDLAATRFTFSDRVFDIVGEPPQGTMSSARFWWERVHPDDVALVREALDAHVLGRTRRIDAEYRLRSADGTWRWVRAVGMAVERDARGRPTRLTGTLRDVTEQREAGDQLRATLEQNERLVRELREALQNVKTLTGLLPICAWCHRIRDDSGYWQKLEAYISSNSEARFTHGMCPACLEKHVSTDGRECRAGCRRTE